MEKQKKRKNLLNLLVKATWKNEKKQHKGKENNLELPEKAELQAIKQAKECERKAKYQVTKKNVNTNDLLNSPSQDA